MEYYSGHIRTRKNEKTGKVKYQLVAERSSHSGKRDRMYRTLPSNTTKRSAERELRNWLTELQNNTFIAPDNMTMCELFKEYQHLFLDIQNTSLSPTTIRNYKNIIKTDLDKFFKNMYVQDINVRTIQEYVNVFSADSKHSSKTIRNHFVLLKKMLDWAQASEIISSNPCNSKALRLPKRSKPQLHVLEREDVLKIIKAAEGTDMEFLTKLLFSTGCRRGEILGLTFDKWSFENKTIEITDNLVCIEHGSVVKKPKMEKIRTIYIGDEMNGLIRQQQIIYKKNKLKYGPDFTDSNLMVCQPNGKGYHPDSITGKWRRFIKANNLPFVRLHDCRHAFASLGIEAGNDVASISRYLGHSQISTTLNMYVNALDDGIKKVANNMDEILFDEAQ